MTKNKLINSNTKQGIDNIKFEINLKNASNEFKEKPLINKFGRKYGYITPSKNKLIVYITLPLFIRTNNSIPFGTSDFEALEDIYKDCAAQINLFKGDITKIRLKSIECNITDQVQGDAKVSDVLNFLCKAFLNYDNDTLKYVAPSDNCYYKEKTQSVVAKRTHYYVFKAYDKTAEQRKHGNYDIDDSLLRIELVLIERILIKLFGKEPKLSDILCAESLQRVINKYNEIFIDIIETKIKLLLNQIYKLLTDSLIETGSISNTIAKEKELIVDCHILQKAIAKWQKQRGVADHSVRDTNKYKDKYDLSSDVIVTLKKFKGYCK